MYSVLPLDLVFKGLEVQVEVWSRIFARAWIDCYNMDWMHYKSQIKVIELQKHFQYAFYPIDQIPKNCPSCWPSSLYPIPQGLIPRYEPHLIQILASEYYSMVAENS